MAEDDKATAEKAAKEKFFGWMDEWFEAKTKARTEEGKKTAEKKTSGMFSDLFGI